MPDLPVERAEASFAVRPGTRATTSHAAVETNFPTGPLIQYAMLGGVFEERTTAILDLRIDLTSDTTPTPPFTSEIAWDRAAIFCGIPQQYLPGIMQGFDLELRDMAFPGGLLHVSVGAHSLFGSSIVAFRRATRMLVKVLTAGRDDMDLWPD